MSRIFESIMHALRPHGATPHAARGTAVEHSGWPSLDAPSGSHRRASDEQPWFREGPEDPWDRDQPPAAKPWS